MAFLLFVLDSFCVFNRCHKRAKGIINAHPEQDLRVFMSPSLTLLLPFRDVETYLTIK